MRRPSKAAPCTIMHTCRTRPALDRVIYSTVYVRTASNPARCFKWLVSRNFPLSQRCNRVCNPPRSLQQITQICAEDPWRILTGLYVPRCSSFSCLISSVSAGRKNTASPSLTPPINDCVHGAMDHRYMVTLKQQAASSIGRRLDTRENRLSFLHDWFDKFTVGQHDSEGTYSNGATSSTSSGPQARLQQVQQAGHKLGSLTSTATSSVQTSSLPTHALHFFAATRLAVAVSASEEVRRAHSTHPRREHRPPATVASFVPHTLTHCPIYTCTRVDHREHGRGPGGLLD